MRFVDQDGIEDMKQELRPNEAAKQALHDLEYVLDEGEGNPMSVEVTLPRLRNALAKAEREA